MDVEPSSNDFLFVRYANRFSVGFFGRLYETGLV